jgi:hypothetical protein
MDNGHLSIVYRLKQKLGVLRVLCGKKYQIKNRLIQTIFLWALTA